MNNKGILAILSGFSGAGKGTAVKRLVEEYGYAVSISATTRAPREGERDGVNYFFKTKEEFEQMIAEDALIEYANYVGNYYGTPKQYVLDRLEEGKDVLLEIEMQGALEIKEKFPEVSLIFITPSTAGELKRRLKKRGTESDEAISKRLARAKEECGYMEQYDYIVPNDGLEECVQNLHALLQSIHFTRGNQKDFIEKIKKDFDQMG